MRSNPVDGENRKEPRVGLRAKADIVVRERTIPVWVRDVSASGVSISCPEEFAADTYVDLALSDSDQIGCSVCHCHRNAAALFSIGLRFLENITQITSHRH